MTTNGVNGHVNGQSKYSVPDETKKVFQQHILDDPRVAKELPSDIAEAAAKVRFSGSPDPSIPVNFRFGEAVASLKGLEASIVNVLLKRKYGTELQDVTIDTDHATLFIMSASMWTIDPGEGGLNISVTGLHDKRPELEKMFPNRDIGRAHATLHRHAATNIYRCADGKYFNLHGDMNSDRALDSIGLPYDMDSASSEEAIDRIQNAVAKIPSEELQRLSTDVNQHSGTVCLTSEEFNNTEHGKAVKDVGLFEIYDKPNASQPASWWPSISSTGVQRPLAGLKVVDLTRVIAAPAVTRGLAELGASVMRCTSPNLPDVSTLHPDLNCAAHAVDAGLRSAHQLSEILADSNPFTLGGKWNCSIDLKKAEDREKLKALIMEADVVISGYRPGALDKHGFGQQDIIDMCKDRERGIISARENCYGWHGPWQYRSGWQQISDAVCGVSAGFGMAMGSAPVQPIFPHSDYCTGLSGACAILLALLRRGEKGGSYAVDLALNYYSAWLVNYVGEYPPEVWDKVWAEHDRVVWKNTNSNTVTGPATVKKLREGPGGERLFKPEFFEDRIAPGILGEKKFRHIRSVAQWPAGTVEAGFRIGTRGNGTDAAHWPDDLSVETVV